ncbi:hypothetical protein BW014_27190 [Salmonella enterica]|uniref:Uncharacterized protein n=1 Tax=Salmonella enterica subsp. enterica serovar Rough O:d:1,7 TaxID=1974323 RepID=A0A974KBK6_SALET|nr:hypothetical protein LFZ16_03225 [Salmonella enterica subsp. enterica serovar India str. SA20085604]EAB2834930.1 hypothetical protein [Salmonella enterica]EBS4089006.1 hypothetical protein [Salmonella enterica subsp. enterica serovar Newport]EBV1275735.1 hypothetical protein [Salmonella enterica subsp. enterica serovar Oranienburg]EBW8396543.1 hypothetical protein [Salmonella enterica subsp. enterica serovar Florida]ECC9940575.1 hypothetical protein [Salmonella enterica subsp. enterica]OSD
MEPDGANILRDTGLISARQIPVTLMKYQPAEDVQTLFHRVNPVLNQGLTVCISRKRGRVWSENIKPFLLISGGSGMNLVHHVDFKQVNII